MGILVFLFTSTVSSAGNFYCPSCPKAEKYARDLVDHMEERQHPSDALIGCPECRDEFALVPF